MNVNIKSNIRNRFNTKNFTKINFAYILGFEI